MDFSTFRLYGSIAIIIGCFIFLYPKLLQPLITAMLGGSGNSKNKDMDDFVPPPMRNRNPQMGDPRQDVSDNIRRNMRHGPHPGMRAAAAEQSKQTKGSGRGMMGVILPMYAVGIVVYLIYTLCKVFNKKTDKHSEERSPERRQPTQSRPVDQFSDEEGRVSKPSVDAMTPQEIKSQLTELQSLANCVKDNDIPEMDMRKLQMRLAETEAQMSKILAAMKSVQGKVDDVTADTVPQAEQNTGCGDTHDNIADEKQSSPTDKDSSTESTPDSESYEIVNKSNEESNGDEDRSGDQPETIQSRTSENVDKNEEEEVGGEESDDETQHTQETNDDGDDTDEEVEEVLMEDKNDRDEEESRTVRKRIPKTDDTES